MSTSLFDPSEGVSLAFDAVKASAREEIAAIENELLRRQWRRSPDSWASEALGSSLWSKQKEILQSIRDNRRTAVRSCHGSGKSFTAATAVAHWLSTHIPGEAFAVTSAPTGRQVRAILWREINRAHGRGGLPGRTNQTEWHMVGLNGHEELVGFGQKPADLDPTAFQGIHARFLLLVFDEACGMPSLLWTAADSLMTNEHCRFLAIGNPDDPTSEFARVCGLGSDWNVISISAFDTPNFTGEAIPTEVSDVLVTRTWVEEKRKLWAPTWVWDEGRCRPPKGASPDDTDPYWQSKVLGTFPARGGPLSLIPETWIEAAMERSLAPTEPNELGVDCGAGGDASVTCHRRGPVCRILSEDRNPNTMETCGKVVEERRQAHAALVKVDSIGIGAGIVDRGREVGEPFVGVNVGQSARDPERFSNLKAENWWAVRERFEAGDIDLDPLDMALAAELSSLRYRRTSRGQIQIESKEEARKRGIASPNRADALMLALSPLPPSAKPKKGGLLW
jgi:hypothetical protein